MSVNQIKNSTDQKIDRLRDYYWIAGSFYFMDTLQNYVGFYIGCNAKPTSVFVFDAHVSSKSNQFLISSTRSYLFIYCVMQNTWKNMCIYF